ncbi:MAG: cytochrome P460 family protein [Bacteroidia bacterium]
MKRNSLSILFFAFTLFVFFQSCKKDNAEGDAADKDLFSETSKSGYTYYQNLTTIFPASGNSPHGFVRVRFNSIAQAVLDSTGKLPVGASFPAGSVIVKEIFTSASGTINQYSIMKKDPGSPVAGSGWIWGEYKTDGSPTFSAGKNGSGCISCHSGSANRDLVRWFDLH